MRTCLLDVFFSPPAHFQPSLSLLIVSICGNDLCGYPRPLEISPIWESFCFITDSVARTRLILFLLMTHIPGLFWNFWNCVHRAEQRAISLATRSTSRPSPLPGSGSRTQLGEISWNLTPCLWVSVWPGWARWCPCPQDPGPCPGSSPCSATCGFPCLCQGWEERFLQPVLKKRGHRLEKSERWDACM